MMPARGIRAAWVSLCAGALGVFLGSSAGCASAGKELSREDDRQQAAWNVLVSPSSGSRARNLGWTAALEQLRHHNAKVLAADLDVARATEALKQVRRSLIPTADFEAGYERLFATGGNLGFEPFTFAANFFFDVPGLFNYRVRYEAAVLTLTHARLVRETVWREQVIALYRAVLDGRDLGDREARLARAGAAIDSLAATAPATAARERGDLADESRELERLRGEWTGRVSEILGLPGVAITLSDGDLPPLPYGPPSGRPDPSQLAQLPLRLAALDLLALRARQLGITLQEWPEIDASVSSPSIYETGPRQILAGVDALWAVDTQGRHASDKRILADETAFRREVLEQEAAASAAKLRSALDGLARTDRNLERIERALSSPDSTFEPELQDARRSLLADRLDWRLTIWFFDDSQWPHDST